MHSLDATLFRLQSLIVAMMVGFWVVAFIGTVGYMLAKRKGLPALLFVGAAGFMVLFVADAVSITLIKQAAMREIFPILSAPVESVTINGELTGQRVHLVDALRRMHDTIGHHSQPTSNFRVLVKTTAGQISLDLARDSDDRHEYWVFDPVYYATSSNAIAHALTDALDSR